MSTDKRARLIQFIEESVYKFTEAETAPFIVNDIIKILNDFEISDKCTDIVVYDDQNDRIIKRYVACCRVDGKSVNTIEQYTLQIRKLIRFLNKPLKEVGPYDIRFYLACEKDKGLQDRTIENERACLSAFFQWMEIEEFIPVNPCRKIKPIKYADVIRKPFTATELDVLRNSCESAKERAILETLVSTGIRVSELQYMNIEDIDFQKMTVHVKNGKGAKERYTYMNEVCVFYLKRYLNSRQDDNPALFLSRKGRLTNAGIRYILNEISGRSGIFNVHPHRFRRTFATSMINRGMDIQEVKELLGHSNIETTMEYIYIEDGKVHESYRRYSR